ncbi:unnamed protein product [Chondrus crispus]|uniref:Uncharacterized protein n=1 Tax=Chondrus crispus TaxID=2769 RepID=R7Q9Z5_CHOCR|nr:unnamed protein product [Chondrus crispus]CDF34231.1 unnamed protein product [Chondrus crispus]|eukprot:XP_005714050.1 unnamed protein product [Chondrus crispus]
MALPSRLGAFMVGAALGSAQCFYWLHTDVTNVAEAMTRKIASVRLEIEEKDRVAGMKVSAIESATKNYRAVEAVPDGVHAGSSA